MDHVGVWAFCGVRSWSALFAYVHFMRRRHDWVNWYLKKGNDSKLPVDL